MARNTSLTRLIDVAPFWRYSRSMPSVQIKNVPNDVHQALQRRARSSGQSMQEFLLARLKEIADDEVMREILERARQRSVDLPPGEIVRMIREDRETH